MKYIAYVREHFSDQKYPIFTLRELRIILKSKGASKTYTKRLVNLLIKKWQLTRITTGIYTFHKDITTVGFAFRPFYYGLQNALTIKKFWEQGVNPIILTTKNVRSGKRIFNGANYIVLRLKKEHFFGYELINYYGLWIPVSDTEKTLIDFIYFKRYLPQDVLIKIKKNINVKKINAYLKHYPAHVGRKVRQVINS